MSAREEQFRERFGQAAGGVEWALGRVARMAGRRGGAVGPALEVPPEDIGDSYRIAWSGGAATVTSSTAVGTIGALGALAEQLRAGRRQDVRRDIPFRTRFYKHELSFEGQQGDRRNPTGRRAVGNYTDRFLEGFFQEIASRHFNALVLYAGYHPFEFFLDYRGFERAAGVPAAVRRRNFLGLRRLLSAAKRYGLRTFLHHYVSHFPATLARRLKLDIGGRLAAYDHPVTNEYNRYVYRRTFQTLPELDGLFMNYESAGSAVAFTQATLMKVARSLRPRPALFFRLWGMSDVPAMAAMVGGYDGPKGLIHKGHETNDLYYYPVADDRIRIWKRAMPDVEFAYSIGPCHNCGTNISGKLWTDPDYVHKLLASFRHKGADSVSFQSSRELLLPHLPDAGIFPKFERDHARMNLAHLEAVVDYFRGRRPGPREWSRRYAGWFRTTPAGGEAVRTATLESSQLILKMYRQFVYGSPQEGYMYPGRFSHYQEPFLYYPMSFLNRIGEIPHNVSWRAWAVRREPVKVVPNDTQAVIDYVNPAVRRRPANHPRAIVGQMQRHIAASKRSAEAYRRAAGRKADRAFLEQVQRNVRNGERIWREIEIAIALYSCYFAPGRRAFFGRLREARRLMLESARVLGERLRDTDAYCSTTASGPYSPAADAEELAAVLACQDEEFPFAALRAYLKSHERYNEIRRMCRPYVSVRQEMVARNRRLLTQSLRAGERAVALLADPRHALYRDNVLAWVDYLRAELDWLTPPAMSCPPDDRVGPEEGFRAMVRDHCYRWGERCWEDFGSFFRRRDFFGPDRCDCRATAGAAGLTVSLREHRIDWAQREALWRHHRGTINQSGFMQVFLDVGATHRRILHYTLHFRGEGGSAGAFEELPGERIVQQPPKPLTGCEGRFRHTDASWRFDLLIPWEQLGRRPRKGERWRMNVFTNPSVTRNRRMIWCQGYEYRTDAARLGTLIFV